MHVIEFDLAKAVATHVVSSSIHIQQFLTNNFDWTNPQNICTFRVLFDHENIISTMIENRIYDN